jgi:monofunctional biosynthetic peptidoglycan transglycosylase
MRIVGLAVLVAVLWVGAYRVINPPGGIYMASEAVRLGGVTRDWVDLDQMSPNLPRAAMAAEDARFCDHSGFDFEAIRAALEANERGGRVRGGSTISQQVAKNVFLWHQRSWVRKGLEAGFTVLIELLWPKDRILEVYLNVAEFDEGIFGVEAASRHYFGRQATGVTLTQAARLAAVLPSPKTRSAARPSGFVQRRGRQIAAGARTLQAEGRDKCAF